MGADDLDGDSAPFEHVVEAAIAAAEDGEVTLRNLLRALGDRSYGPLIALLGLVASTPLAAFPGAAGVIALIILALAVQMAVGRIHPWLPGFVLRLAVSEEKARAAYEAAAPWLRRLDGFITPRWSFLAGTISRRAAAICVIILSLLIIPLEAVPFAVVVPAVGVAIFGAAITARDGLAMAIGFAIVGGAFWLSWRVFFA